MSKRGPGANFGGDERYGKSQNSESMPDNEQPTRATAAQMARRKIAQAKSSNRRSASPAVSTGPIGGVNTQFQLPTPGANASGFDFSFGQTTPSFGQTQQNGSPAPFQLGSGMQPQQNSSNIFAQSGTGNAGTSFNSTTPQPQQNGFAPAASSNFGQQQSNSSFNQFGQSQSNSSSFTFGQNPPNGATPATTTSSIFKSFGQQNQTNGQNGTSFKFGASQQQTQDSGSGSIFGGFGQKSQENGDKPEPTGTNTPFGGLSQATQSNGNKNLFGASTPATSFNSSSLATTNIFSNVGQKPLANGDKSLFPSTPSTQEIPKPTTSNIFSSFSTQTGTNGGTSNSVPSNPSSSIFAFGQSQANGTKPAHTEPQTADGVKAPLFGASQPEQQTPKQSTLFQPYSQATPSQQDANMTTPDQTPRKSTNETSLTPPESSSTPAPSSVAQQPRSLFDRIEPKAPTQTPASLAPTTSSEQTQNAAPKSLFTPSTNSMFGSSLQAVTPQPPVSQSIIQPPNTAPAKSLFDRIQPPSPPQVRPQTDAFSSSIARGPPVVTATTSAALAPTSNELTPRQKKKLRGLNSGLLQHLQAADRERDWSEVFRFYELQVARITSGDNGGTAAPGLNGTAKPAPAAFKAAAPLTAAQTPKASTSTSNLFSRPPETAPVQKRRLFEDDEDTPVQPPATEKRIKPSEPMSYPKLPESASKTAKLFEAALGKPTTSSPAGFTPSAKPLFSAVQEKSKATSATAAPSAGFKPTGFTPTFSVKAGGNDMFAAFGKAAKAEEEKERSKRKAEDYDSDEETPEEWESRDRAEQERKRSKIAEAAQAGAGFKFNPSANATSSPKSPPTSPPKLAASASEVTATETPQTQLKSLFDRTAPASPPKTAPPKPSLFAAQTPQAPATAIHSSTSNIFGQQASDSSKSSANIFGFLRDKSSAQLGEDVEKEQGSGDKTFKPNTPIKFGTSVTSTTPAAAPPKFTGLFGSTAPPSGFSIGDAAAGKLAPPSTGFMFGAKAGSLDVSRATTPGITTDGEGSTATGADDADGEERELPQAEDQTALQPDEKKANDVLFELGEGKNALCKKYEDKQGTKEWVSKGKGRLYIVKDKVSGKVRIMLKIAPYGRLAMNYEPVKGIEYKVSPGAGKTVSGAFFDHLHTSEPKLGQFTVQVKEAADAKEIARILNEEKQQ